MSGVTACRPAPHHLPTLHGACSPSMQPEPVKPSPTYNVHPCTYRAPFKIEAPCANAPEDPQQHTQLHPPCAKPRQNIARVSIRHGDRAAPVLLLQLLPPGALLRARGAG